MTLRCSTCTATILADALPESGWAILAGKPYCPVHVARAGILDGIEQDCEVPELVLREVSDGALARIDDTIDMDPTEEGR